jgi:hypothetical protein
VPRIAFLRQIIESIPAPGIIPLDTGTARQITSDGGWNQGAAGHNRTDYYLFYLGMHQPRFRNFNLPEGMYRLDVIDTWNMTVDRAADRASGQVCVVLPRKKYLAVRLQRLY